MIVTGNVVTRGYCDGQELHSTFRVKEISGSVVPGVQDLYSSGDEDWSDLSLFHLYKLKQVTCRT